MRRGLVWAAALAAGLAGGGPAAAAEYRLQVASLFETAFTSFLAGPADLADRAASPALDRLGRSLDQGRMPRGAVLYDRHLRATSGGIADAYGGARVVATLTDGGEGRVLWDEARWEGKPGEHSVWVVAAGARWTQELYRVALRGSGPLRYAQPSAPPWDPRKLVAASFPLNFLWFHEERGTVWDKEIARRLDLAEGIGAVVGVNTNPTFSDQVYLIVKHAEQPTTYQAVLVWRQRESERETPKLHPVR